MKEKSIVSDFLLPKANRLRSSYRSFADLRSHVESGTDQKITMCMNKHLLKGATLQELVLLAARDRARLPKARAFQTPSRVVSHINYMVTKKGWMIDQNRHGVYRLIGYRTERDALAVAEHKNQRGYPADDRKHAERQLGGRAEDKPKDKKKHRQSISPQIKLSADAEVAGYGGDEVAQPSFTMPESARATKPQWSRSSLLKVLGAFLVAPTTEDRALDQVVSELAVSTGMPASAIITLLHELQVKKGDFLNALAPDQICLLHNDEREAAVAGRDLISLAEEGLRDLQDDAPSIVKRLSNTHGEDVLSVQGSRRGQGLFRVAVMRNYEGRCCISHLRVGALLQATHIAPWSEFEDRRLDLANGLCLNALLHSAYDALLLTITPSGVVLVRRDILSLCRDEKKSEYHTLGKYHMKRILAARHSQPDPILLAEHQKRSGISGY